MAHISGGGLIDNVPRVLPEGLAARCKSKSWVVPPIFKLIEKRGNIDRSEMFHVFNMGIGMAIICSPENTDHFTKVLPEAKLIGEVIKQGSKARVVIE